MKTAKFNWKGLMVLDRRVSKISRLQDTFCRRSWRRADWPRTPSAIFSRRLRSAIWGSATASAGRISSPRHWTNTTRVWNCARNLTTCSSRATWQRSTSWLGTQSSTRIRTAVIWTLSKITNSLLTFWRGTLKGILQAKVSNYQSAKYQLSS